jgi:hypothetical protein
MELLIINALAIGLGGMQPVMWNDKVGMTKAVSMINGPIDMIVAN